MTTLLLALLLLAVFWLVAGIYRVGDALWHIQADIHDIRCSVIAVGEPAYRLLTVLNKQNLHRPDWIAEPHNGPICFPD